jgi:hypothetical protein
VGRGTQARTAAILVIALSALGMRRGIAYISPAAMCALDKQAGHKTQLRNLAHVDEVLKHMLNLLRDRGEVANT